MKSKLPLTLGAIFATASFAAAQQPNTTVWNVAPTDPITPGNWAVGPWTPGVPTTDSLAGILNGDTVAVNAETVTNLEQILVTGGSTLNINALIGVVGTNAVPAVPPVEAVPASGFFVGTGTLNVNSGGDLQVTDGGEVSIGKGGAAVLNLLEGGNFTTNRTVMIGQEAGGNAIVNQTGGSITHTTPASPVSEFRVGTFGATTVFNISGGRAELSNLRLSYGNGASTGTFNQTGENSEVIITGESGIGWNSGGNATYNMENGYLNAKARFRLGIGTSVRTNLFKQTGGLVEVSGRVDIGDAAGPTNIVDLSGGKLTATDSMFVGANGTGTGILKVSGAAEVGVKNLVVGRVNQGTVEMTGGKLNVTQRIYFGDEPNAVALTSTNLFNQTGGDVVALSRVDIGMWEGPTNLYQISGGTLTVSDRILVGFGRLFGTAPNQVAHFGTGTFTISGAAAVTAKSVVIGENSASVGTVNLNGGILTTDQIKVGLGIAANQTLNLNGGTIKARTDLTELIAANVTTASLQSGGITFDSNNFTVSTAAVMTGSGGLTKKGGGTLTVNSVQKYTGNTTVTEGTLKLTQPYLADNGDVYLVTGAVLDLTYAPVDPLADPLVYPTDTIRTLYIDGVPQPIKNYGGTGTGADTVLDALMIGTGKLRATSAGVTIPPVINSITVSGATATITMAGAPTTTYVCKFSDDLVTPFAPIVTVPANVTTDGSGNATFTVDASVAKRFYVVGKE